MGDAKIWHGRERLHYVVGSRPHWYSYSPDLLPNLKTLNISGQSIMFQKCPMPDEQLFWFERPISRRLGNLFDFAKSMLIKHVEVNLVGLDANDMARLNCS